VQARRAREAETRELQGPSHELERDTSALMTAHATTRPEMGGATDVRWQVPGSPSRVLQDLVAAPSVDYFGCSESTVRLHR